VFSCVARGFKPQALLSGQIEQALHERGADVLAAGCLVDDYFLDVTAITGQGW
jgi:hypothetical protein